MKRLTEHHLKVLAAIQARPDATLKELGAEFGVSRERIRQISARLEEFGLLAPRVEARLAVLEEQRISMRTNQARLARIHRMLKRTRRLRRLRRLANLRADGIGRAAPGATGSGTVCAFSGCGRAVRARGYCDLHYGTLRKSGVLWVERRQNVGCADCGAPTYARGYCQYHYQRRRKDGTLARVQEANPSAARPIAPPIQRDGDRWVVTINGQERRFVSEATALQAWDRAQGQGHNQRIGTKG